MWKSVLNRETVAVKSAYSFASRKRLPLGRCSEYQPLEPRNLLAGDILAGSLNAGVAVADDATGDGYILYSQQDVHTRFDGIRADNADQFVAVRLSQTQWQYNNDVTWVDFDPAPEDRLVAAANFSSDKVVTFNRYQGIRQVEGIRAGFQSGDLWFTANHFDGDDDEGEFQVLGASFQVEDVVSSATQSQTKIGQLGFAALAYEIEQGELPDLAIYDDEGTPLLSWRVQLLPYLGLTELYEQFHLDEPWNSPHNLSLVENMPDAFESPNFSGSGKTVFQAVGGEGTLFPLTSEAITFSNLSDGQDTILFVEANADRAVEWTRPRDLTFQPQNPLRGLGDISANGFAAVTAGGSVFTIPNSISPDNLANLLLRDDGQAIDYTEFTSSNSAELSLRSLAFGLLNYESANQHFPAHAIYSDAGSPLLSWRVELLPFLGYENLYEQFHLDEPWDSSHNLSLLPLMPRIFQNLDLPVGMTNYLGVSGTDSFFDLTDHERTLNEFAGDGFSNTLMVVEADRAEAVEWTRPTDLLFSPSDPFRGLSDVNVDGVAGFNGAFADGDIEHVPVTAGVENVTSMALINDGGFVDFNDFTDPEAIEVNLRDLALGALNFESAQQRLPAHAIYSDDGQPLLSWRVAILPFIGQQDLYDQFNLDEAWDSPNNLPLLDLMPRVFSTAGTPDGFTTVLAATGDGTAFPIGEQGTQTGSFEDGLQNTALFVQVNLDQAVEWTRPADLAFNSESPRDGLGAATASGFNVVMGNGEVVFIPNTVSDQTVSYILQRNDGQPYSTDFIPPSLPIAQNREVQNNLRNVALAALNYESARQRFPAHAIYSDDGVPLLSWRVSLLPFLGYNNLYQQFNLDEAWDSPNNLALLQFTPRELSHPSVENTKTVFQAVTGDDTAFPIQERGTTIRSFLDGTSNTILFAEADIDQAVEWTKPQDLIYDETNPKRGLTQASPSGSHVVLADGSTLFIPADIDAESLSRLYRPQ